MNDARRDELRLEVMSELNLGDDYSALSQADKMKVGREVKSRFVSEDEKQESATPAPVASEDKVRKWYFVGANHRDTWTDDAGERHHLRVQNHILELDISNPASAEVDRHLEASPFNGVQYKRVQMSAGGIGDIVSTINKADNMSVDQLRAVLSDEEMKSVGLHPSDANHDRLKAAVVKLNKKL